MGIVVQTGDMINNHNCLFREHVIFQREDTSDIENVFYPKKSEKEYINKSIGKSHNCNNY